MKPDEPQDWRSMGRRNEADMRMVGGIIGVLTGGCAGLFLEMRLARGMDEVSMWGWLIFPFVGAVIGGVIGYFQDTWRSGL